MSQVVRHRLRLQLITILREAIGGAKDCIVLDYPAHSNVGDNLILLGELEALQELGVKVHRISHLSATAIPDLSRHVPPEFLILLHGGGNFGDLYPKHQVFREAVLAALPKNRVLLLPQTVHFARAKEMAASARELARHRDFEILVRDEESLVVTRDTMGLQSRLCPDAAFAVTGLKRTPSARDLLGLWRTDIEGSAEHGGHTSDIHETDWPQLDNARQRRFLLAAAARAQPARGRGIAGDRLRSLICVGCYRLAAARTVARGVKALDADVVVTDRLHGHILCVLLDIPHVLVDNNYGKLSRFATLWDSDTGAHWATTRRDAVAIARGILAAG